MPTLTIRELFTEYATGRRDFRRLTITPENEWMLPPISDLSALILCDAKVNGINFEGADLRYSDFSRASLVGDLSEAVLIGATLSEADLTGADLTRALCSEANFDRARLGPRLSGANMTGATLRRADLTGGQADNAVFNRADLREVKLAGANLSTSSFRDADLSGSDLQGANFYLADLTNSNLMDCRANHARFDKAVLKGSDVEGISLIDASLRSAHLFEVAWLNSDLTRADLSSARLDGGSIRNCRLVQVHAPQAVLSGVVIVSSDLTGIELTGANITRCLWQDVTFDDAKLDGAELKGAILRRSSGRHTNLSQAQLRTAVIDHETLTSLPALPIQPEPGPTEEVIHFDTKMFNAIPATEVSIVRIFYATDRKPGGDGFGSERADRLRYGVCEVSIPRDHRMGELEAPSVWRLQFDWDPNQHLTVTAVSERTPTRFFEHIRHRAQASSSCEALMFVHGYNVSFEDAMRRAGQLAYDLSFDGPVIAYSWASRADARLYTYDEATIEDTIPRLTAFIQQVAERAFVRRLHIIAHSMGNRALIRALQQLPATEKSLLSVRHVILTAPDIDAGVFKGIAAQMCAAAHQVTMYASSNDVAIQLSKKFHGYHRAGEGGSRVIVVKGVSTIDASELETDLLGHSYFADHRSVVSDIYYLLQDRPPERRFGLVSVRHGSRKYWRFRTEGRQSTFARLLSWWRRRAKIKRMLSVSF